MTDDRQTETQTFLKRSKLEVVIWKCTPTNVSKGTVTLQGKAYGHESRRKHRAWMVISFHPMVLTFGRELGRCVLRSFYNACTWPALGDLIYFLTVNVLAPTVTKWNKACDQKVGTIEKIHQQTKHYRQHGFVVRTATLDYFRTLLLTETCKIPINIMSMFSCVCGSPTFVSISWMCKKQTAVSHRSAESGIISLDAG